VLRHYKREVRRPLDPVVVRLVVDWVCAVTSRDTTAAADAH
jgi:hypothetical protein